MAVYDVNGVKIGSVDDDYNGLDGINPNRVLIWHDEFLKEKINPEKWSVVYGKGISNYRAYYANDTDLVMSSGSGLRYRTVRNNPDEGYEFSSPFISTKNHFEFLYGRIEAKIKFPTETPHHSTFWTLGACYDRKINGQNEMYSEEGVAFPSCGEIDIAEFDNGKAAARTHWSLEGFDTSDYTTGGNVVFAETASNWHVYACEWTEETIQFFVDGTLKKTWSTSEAEVNGWNPFNHPHYLILNCLHYTSGAAQWDVAQTDVAWVRVYAPEGVSRYIEETDITIPQSKTVNVGDREWIDAVFYPTNASDKTLKWISHNESIATCYGGMIVGIAEGTTLIQCTTKHGYTAFCKVTVTQTT